MRTSTSFVTGLILTLALAATSAQAQRRPAGPALGSRLDPRQPGFWDVRAQVRPLIVGSAALDTIQTPDGITRKRILGGSAVYAAVAASKSSTPLIVAPIGKDFPARYVKQLSKSGVDVKGLQRSEGLSFAWSGRYLDSKDRVTVDTQLGVLGSFKPDVPKGYQPKVVFLANMAPAQQQQVLDQLQASGKGRPRVIVDTMNLWIQGHRPALEKVMKRADLLLLNDEEAPMLAGTADLASAARKVLTMGPKMVIVKQGKHGASLYYKAGGEVRSFSVPVVPVKVVDTTGAGDSFGGALLSYVARAGSFSPKTVGLGMIFASAVASSTVESFSTTRLTHLTQQEIGRRFDHLARQLDLGSLGR